MREVIKIYYTYDELSEEDKEKVLARMQETATDYDWWNYVCDDAKNIGLDIIAFDLDSSSYVKAKFRVSASDTAERILQEHGEACETYRTAAQYQQDRDEFIFDEEMRAKREGEEFYPDEIDTEEIDREFLRMLCEDYRIILQKELEYLHSREAIEETIRANEYEFEAGTLRLA